MAVALSSDPDRVRSAVGYWEDALEVQVPEDEKSWAYRGYVKMASLSISKHIFDSVRAKLISTPTMTMDEKDVLWRELDNDIKFPSIVLLDLDNEFGIDSIDRYKAAWCFLAGKDEVARGLCSYDLNNAFGILLDEDEGNDGIGIDKLVKVLCCSGDKVGALTAWSLFDRRGRRNITSNGWRQGPDLMRDTELLADDCRLAACDGCNKMLQSSDPDGMWCCRFCPNFDLCPPCHDGMVQGDLKLHLCNPKHEFWYFYHTEYTPEEVAYGKVRIDWKLEDRGNGKFLRHGGRIVDLKIWLEELRLRWEIPELVIESRAQK